MKALTRRFCYDPITDEVHLARPIKSLIKWAKNYFKPVYSHPLQVSIVTHKDTYGMKLIPLHGKLLSSDEINRLWDMEKITGLSWPDLVKCHIK
jgi:hypothetical protein